MPLTFEPLSEEDIYKKNLLEKGVYQYEVVQATEGTSRVGNKRIELIVKVWDKSGREHVIYDYLMASVLRKLRNFCYINGMGEKYETGSLADTDCLGKTGHCSVRIEVDKSGQYPPKNSINDYVESVSETKPPMPPVDKGAAFVDSDLPF